MYLVVPPGGCFPEMRRIELGPGAVTIGRAESCEIHVDVPGVDQEHAKISEVALVALGPDCAIGDVPLDPGARRLLMPGDEIQIGSVVIALEGDDPSLPPPPLDTQITSRLGGHTLEAPRVRVVEGAAFGDELLMKEEGHEYLVGRGTSCDLVLDDREVSREHLKLVRRGYTVFIKDLSSTRGSWLGRAAVYTGATIEWTRPRMLRVGVTVLALELPAEIRRAAPAAQTSAPMTPPPRSRKNTGGSPSSPPAGPFAAPPPSGRATEPGAPAVASTERLGSFRREPAVEPSVPPAVASRPGPPSSPVDCGSRALGSLPPSPRTAWKKSGPTIGRASGLLLLALGGIVILGALFVVFSLLE